MWKLPRELVRWLRRVDQYPATGLQTRDDRRSDQRRIEHDNMIRFVDQIAIRDRIF
jgi:hypothetical protein